MNLNYELFPKMDKGYLIIPEPDERTQLDTDIYTRFCSAIYLASHIGTDESNHIISNKNIKTTYLRAALAEFITIEELLKVNYPNNADIECCSLIKNENPVFHFLKILRNYNIHLSNSSLGVTNYRAYSPRKPEMIFELNSPIIDNLHVEEFKKLKVFKNNKSRLYSEQDILKMISYFEKEQSSFGVCDLIIRSIIDYSVIVGSFLKNNRIPL
ncbi:hypothetical protein H5119_18740 [Pseudoalteromonas sp. SG45-5]|uniref:hypothetical protein n=2 Tax=Pseudoalteromonas TaxID=53246 RepID=UPI0015F8210A|nr:MULTISPECIES: hypothetical protein [unclassified Pseudoalteromonas]MBB1387543.1 hypothetical protein [Pseudoalteromonas sp. SG45-5]MBB1395771.1 hypothetical protein [Pseudoalteromonas sp. SG44-4]